MRYLRIDEWSIEELRKRLDGKFSIEPYSPSGSWQTSRYIQIVLDGYDGNTLHYEYRVDGDWNGRLELHFEGELKPEYASLVDHLIDETQNCEDITSFEWGWGYCFQYSKIIGTMDDLCNSISYMVEKFKGIILQRNSETYMFEDRTIEIDDRLSGLSNVEVEVFERKYDDVVRLPLSIPDYQRIYCWGKDNVKCLLNDVFEHVESNNNALYRLGTIILHSHDNKYDIIDGQQRLVTLALLLSEAGIKTALLEEKFSSKLSKEYIAYNKYIIHEYVQRYLGIRSNIEKLLEVLEFNVLVLQNTSIDLAYTFFSNQNSRGVALTDYDLLKAHHLRYIPSASEQQAKLSAEIWNKMIEEGRRETDDVTLPDYEITLDTYLYRLRKWMRKGQCDDSKHNYRIKKEYEAASVIDEIPPFGERFYFNEPIQGGTHFFSYVEQHLDKYRQFCDTKEYNALHEEIQGSSGQWYRDAIESVLFCYFLKFGSYYLSEALLVIMRVLLQHRYVNRRARKSSITNYVGDSELVLMIDRATSPTFFLAEARNRAKDLSYPMRQTMVPIMRAMRSKAKNIADKLKGRIVVESFKNINR